MIRKALILIALFIHFNLNAQTSLYQWRDHLSYTQGKKTAVSSNKVYCLADGALFALNLNNNSLERISKITGLTGTSYSTIAYSEYSNTLVIGYSDGNIDLLTGNKIYNLSDIKRKSIIGSKSINNITFNNELAYLSCGFGIVVLNIEKQEIKDTYYIGEDGSQVNVNAILINNTHIYAATNNGLFRALSNSSNLVDYNDWEKISFLPNPDDIYNAIAFFNNKTYVNYSNSAGDDIIYEIYENTANILSLSYTGNNNSLFGNNDYLIIANSKMVLFYNKTGSVSKTIDDTYYWGPQINYAEMHNNITYIADNEHGLGIFSEDNKLTFYKPNGPKYKQAFRIDIQDGEIWATAGGPNYKWSSLGGYTFIDEKWNSIHRRYDNSISDILNFSIVQINPGNTNHVYFGSYGSGLVEYLNNEFVELYDQSNSVLENVPGYTSGYINITGMNFDSKNNLWLCTTMSDNPVYVKATGEDIIKIDFEYDGFSASQRVSDILVTSNDNKWLLLDRSGIFVFDHEPGEGEYNERFFSVKDRDGQVISNELNSIAEDLNGNIWVGTDEGPVVYYNPESVFNTDNEIYASQVLIPRNDGTDLADPLLETEVIRTIAIDGADRKWMGTQNAGAFLISKDGTKEIFNFNTNNSPIFSNTILDISINHETGEVFFATDKGIESFRSTATKGNDDFQDVYTFPNPVRENYFGDITITGLVENVNVKITDISGNLVYETTALGGQAIWNGKNFDGKRVQTGVYLVFCTNDDGTKTHVTKILFIN